MYRDLRLMQTAETAEFLRRQQVAKVDTVDANGRSYRVPLVYIYEGGDLLYLLAHVCAFRGLPYW